MFTHTLRSYLRQQQQQKTVTNTACSYCGKITQNPTLAETALRGIDQQNDARQTDICLLQNNLILTTSVKVTETYHHPVPSPQLKVS